MIKKIRTEDLQVGMFVDDFNVPWMDHPFLTSKRLLKKAKDIQVLVDQRIEEVYIDTEKGRDSAKAVSATEADDEVRRELAAPTPPPETDPTADVAGDTTPFGQEVRRARAVYGQAKSLVQDLLLDARLGNSLDGERAVAVVDEMVDSIFRNQDALASLTRLKSFDDYTFQHSVNVSVLALALGRHLGLVKGELRRLGIGAILHDVGKMRVPEEILHKPSRLTDAEFTVMKTHPLHGAKILMSTRALPEDCSSVALNHHERFNGVGYPRGLSGLAIGKFGLISSLADVYDAITSNRVYHTGMPSHQAVQKIYEWTKTDFYPLYAQKFIQCLGIFPIGSVVRLDTGEVGVVARQNHDQLLRPWVRIVRGSVVVFEVDLRAPDPKGEKPFARTVSSALDPAAAGFDVEALLAEPERAAA